MKRIFLLSFLVLINAAALFASDKNEDFESLLGNGEVKFGGWGGPSLKPQQVDNSIGLSVGGCGGLLINGTFTVGLGGYGLVTNHEVKDYLTTDTSVYLRTGYGGLYLSYTDSPTKLLHLTFSTLIGAGGASYTNSWSSMIHDERSNRDWAYESSAFFIVEFGAGVELNVSRWMRIDLGADYRFVSGIELSRHTSSDIGGFGGHLNFKFGKFD